MLRKVKYLNNIMSRTTGLLKEKLSQCLDFTALKLHKKQFVELKPCVRLERGRLKNFKVPFLKLNL